MMLCNKNFEAQKHDTNIYVNLFLTHYLQTLNTYNQFIESAWNGAELKKSHLDI